MAPSESGLEGSDRRESDAGEPDGFDTFARSLAAFDLLTGDWMGPEEAVARGLAWRQYPSEELLPEALSLARRIVAAPLEAVRDTKRLLQADRPDAVAAALDREIVSLNDIVRRLLNS